MRASRESAADQAAGLCQAPEWRLLMIEDSADDAELIRLNLEQAGLRPAITRVARRDDLHRCLAAADWDVVLSDHHLPDLDAMLALELVSGRRPGLPFIIVSGSLPDDLVRAAIERGARDFVSKSDLARLAAVIEREIGSAQVAGRLRGVGQ